MLAFLLDTATVVLTIRIVLMALMLISAVYVVIVVMQQEDNSEGLGALAGQNSENESFYGKNKAKNKEHRQKIWTIIASCVMAVCSIVFFILAK
jgi:protein translocase SecG subunit